jgi:hypothetical protein
MHPARRKCDRERLARRKQVPLSRDVGYRLWPQAFGQRNRGIRRSGGSEEIVHEFGGMSDAQFLRAPLKGWIMRRTVSQ